MKKNKNKLDDIVKFTDPLFSGNNSLDQKEDKQPEKNEVISSYDKDIITITFVIKDEYLPNVLVKLGLFKNNAEARTYIRKDGITLNGKKTKNCDATNGSNNFTINWGNTIWEVFKV